MNRPSLHRVVEARQKEKNTFWSLAISHIESSSLYKAALIR
ncbi:hypothetical protein BofuT4_P007080.1 [Botrytis cinerea T4]|uniref:Uncharacterized protein n=1 Tax=Botryotinia fuckeliana (strain T4) TaxID=999810 RepID=G2Y4F9_BOTF4|nr:hypothetical protein BofuT4_P007080.1 [Botrytis cinerea T4]